LLLEVLLSALFTTFLQLALDLVSDSSERFSASRIFSLQYWFNLSPKRRWIFFSANSSVVLRLKFRVNCAEQYYSVFFGQSHKAMSLI